MVSVVMSRPSPQGVATDPHQDATVIPGKSRTRTFFDVLFKRTPTASSVVTPSNISSPLPPSAPLSPTSPLPSKPPPVIPALRLSGDTDPRVAPPNRAPVTKPEPLARKGDDQPQGSSSQTSTPEDGKVKSGPALAAAKVIILRKTLIIQHWFRGWLSHRNRNAVLIYKNWVLAEEKHREATMWAKSQPRPEPDTTDFMEENPGRSSTSSTSSIESTNDQQPLEKFRPKAITWLYITKSNTFRHKFHAWYTEMIQVSRERRRFSMICANPQANLGINELTTYANLENEFEKLLERAPKFRFDINSVSLRELRKALKQVVHIDDFQGAGSLEKALGATRSERNLCRPSAKNARSNSSSRPDSCSPTVSSSSKDSSFPCSPTTASVPDQPLQPLVRASSLLPASATYSFSPTRAPSMSTSQNNALTSPFSKTPPASFPLQNGSPPTSPLLLSSFPKSQTTSAVPTMTHSPSFASTISTMTTLTTIPTSPTPAIRPFSPTRGFSLRTTPLTGLTHVTPTESGSTSAKSAPTFRPASPITSLSPTRMLSKSSSVSGQGVGVTMMMTTAGSVRPFSPSRTFSTRNSPKIQVLNSEKRDDFNVSPTTASSQPPLSSPASQPTMWSPSSGSSLARLKFSFSLPVNANTNATTAAATSSENKGSGVLGPSASATTTALPRLTHSPSQKEI